MTRNTDIRFHGISKNLIQERIRWKCNGNTTVLLLAASRKDRTSGGKYWIFFIFGDF
jgi:hypothetical protein